MNDYIKDYTRARRSIDAGLQRYMVKVYLHMTCALLITALAAAAVLSFPPLTNLLFKTDQWGNLISCTLLGYGVMVAPFFIAMYLSASFFRRPFAHSRFLFGLYAALIGISFAQLALFYTTDSLHKTFLITAFTFGSMSLYGYTTNRDLSSVGSFCIMATWGLIISAIFNIFLYSSMVYFVSGFVGVVVSIAFVAYNTQKIKSVYYDLQETALAEKASLMGAFSLYINFLNLFLYLLRFLGEQRRRD